MIQVVKDYYQRTFNFTSEDLRIVFEFEMDMICLNVPDDGTKLKDDWKIYPCYKPAVSYLELYSNFIGATSNKKQQKYFSHQ